MKLNEFMAMNAVKQNKFAEQIGTSPKKISKYCLGAAIPRPAVMRKIYAATGGLVDANSFYDLPSLLTPTGSAADASVVGSDPSEGENAALSKASCCRPSVDDSDKREGQKS